VTDARVVKKKVEHNRHIGDERTRRTSMSPPVVTFDTQSCVLPMPIEKVFAMTKDLSVTT